MEDAFMDRETADKIVESYQQLKSLETILLQSPFADWSQLAASPKQLNQNMNQLLKLTTYSSFQKEIAEMLSQIETYKSQSDQLQCHFPCPEMNIIFGQLLANFQFLQTKFTKEQD